MHAVTVGREYRGLSPASAVPIGPATRCTRPRCTQWRFDVRVICADVAGRLTIPRGVGLPH
jgi:hypothetical protein